MAISGPIPPYNNPAIEPQFFQPSRFVIENITLGKTTTITTTEDNNYVIGQLVRLIIPPSFGTRVLNGQTAYVISIPASNQVELDLYTVGIDPFIASDATTQAQILGIGDINSGIVSTTGRVQATTNIPGSFINISPE